MILTKFFSQNVQRLLVEALGQCELPSGVTGFRERGKEYENNPDLVKSAVEEGCDEAREEARATLDDVREAMGLNYR